MFFSPNVIYGQEYGHVVKNLTKVEVTDLNASNFDHEVNQNCKIVIWVTL